MENKGIIISLIVITTILISLIISLIFVIYNKNKYSEKDIIEICDIKNKKKTKVKNKKINIKKLFLIIDIIIISILAILQFILNCTIIFTFIANALTLPIILLTILAIILNHNINIDKNTN